MSKFFEDKRDEAFGVDRHASMGSIRAKNMEMFYPKRAARRARNPPSAFERISI
jgi:hypothetical protein